MRRGSPFLIGLFVIIGLALVVLGVLAGTGGKLFVRKERVVMYFDTSVYGLQVGAPVVFRGVRMGSVVGIGLLHDESSDRFTIPVVAELEREGITTEHPDGSREKRAMRLADLIGRGMTAQLSMQSFLTGQQYVDLDMRPGKPALRRGSQRQLTEIPTTVTTIQNLKAQLEELDLRGLAEDVGAIAQSARSMLAGPELKQALADTRQMMANLRRLSERLDRRADPLANAAQATLGETRQTMVAANQALERVGRAADGIGDTAQRFGRTSDQVSALVAPEAPLVQSLQRTAQDLSQAAAGLREATGSEAPLMEGLQRTMADVSRASRAVRELADLLERHPNALLRGKPAAEAKP